MITKTFKLALMATAGICAGTVAGAQRIVAHDGTAIANFFIEEGANVELREDSYGDPLVEVEQYGIDYDVFFYGCDDNGVKCQSIQFYTGYATNGAIRNAKINDWNSNNRFTKAYIDTDDGGAVLRMDIFLGKSGMNDDDFAKAVSLWSRGQREFEEFIGW